MFGLACNYLQDHHMIDVFIVYQEQYRGFRDAIKCAVFENQVNELESLQVRIGLYA